MKISLWNNNSNYCTLADGLQKLIPDTGEVKNKADNPHLEKLRIAVNCYYDLYNNGLGNMRKEFYKLFKIASSKHYTKDFYTDEFLLLVENKMQKFLINAAKEQNISV
jgi:hypothetical protein